MPPHRRRYDSPDLQSMSDQQIIERLATKVMNWVWKPYGIVPSIGGWIDEDGGDMGYWNPVKDWNDWRMVEEKVMENDVNQNGTVLVDMMLKASKRKPLECNAITMGFLAFDYIKSDLPTRCRALISALEQ